jgi:DNA-binding Lrp family transcriptional regulator
MIRDTSLDTYIRLRNYLGEKQIEIYRYIRENSYISRKEIAKGLNVEINTVCGRVKELLQIGLVKEGAKKICPYTNNEVHSLYSFENIDWSLLDIKKTMKTDLIKLNKQHIPTIRILLDHLKNSVKDLDILKKYGKNGIYEGIQQLEEDLEEITNKLDNCFLFQNLGFKLIFKVHSESKNCFYNVEYNTLNYYIGCDCEDHIYRNSRCKHIRQVIKKFELLKAR